MFIENIGQFDAPARFQVRGGGRTLWLADHALWFTVLERPYVDASQRRARPVWEHIGTLDEDQPRRGVNLKLSFVGANPHPRLEPFNRLDTHVSYFTGNDPAKWHPDVPVWGGVRYVDLYPGIDLEMSGAGGQWQPRIIAHPGADLSTVRLRVEGADALALDGDCLRLTTAVGTFSLPAILTGDGAALQPTVTNHTITLAPSPFNLLPKSVDSAPTDLLYSTFVGGSHDDLGFSIAVDAGAAAYVTGLTSSSDFPTTPGAFQTTYGGDEYDAYVAKVNATGRELVYSTFLGGSGLDSGQSIAVDSNGSAYISGLTASSDFPTTAGAFQTSFGGGFSDAFVTKLNATGGSLVYSTLLGGENGDQIVDVALNTSGPAYVTGLTDSTDFPVTPGAFQTTSGGGLHAFVTKLNADGSSLGYSTYLGGSSFDEGLSIAVDANGAACVSGVTGSSDFPTTPGAFQTTYGGGIQDSFISKLDASGSELVYSTFLGGSNIDCFRTVCPIAVDANGSAYVAGNTMSTDFPTTPGAFQTSYRGGFTDVFVVKLDASGSGLVYSTFLGGGGTDQGIGIAIDMSGSAYVTGSTDSTDFPITPGAFQKTWGGDNCGLYPCPDAFLTKLNATGSALLYSTYLGGNYDDYGEGIAVDGSGVAYITGWTHSPNFPITPGAFDPTCGGCPNAVDAFVTRLLPVVTPNRVYLPFIWNNP